MRRLPIPVHMIVTVLFLLTGVHASGQPVTVDVLRTGGIVDTLQYNDGAAIDLTTLADLDSVTLIRAYSTNPDNSANIGHIDLAGTRTAGGTLDVLIGRAGAINPFPEELLSAAATNWSGITVSSGLVNKVRLSGAILGDVNGPINVGEIVRLQCGGRISANVTVQNAGLALGRLVASETAPGATILAEQGSIGTLQFTASSTTVPVLNIGGDVLVPQGSIDAILAPGWIGGLEGTAPQVLARDGILTIEALVIASATVRGNAYSGSGHLRRIVVQAVYDATIQGNDLLADPGNP